jgi:hypothetical protein
VPRPDAPPPALPNGTDFLKQLPVGLLYVDCTTGFHTNEKRVHVRLEGRFNGEDENELLGGVRAGLWVWQHFLGPALRAYCLSHGVGFTLHEVTVESAPRPALPNKHRRTKPFA